MEAPAAVWEEAAIAPTATVAAAAVEAAASTAVAAAAEVAALAAAMGTAGTSVVAALHKGSVAAVSGRLRRSTGVGQRMQPRGPTREASSSKAASRVSHMAWKTAQGCQRCHRDMRGTTSTAAAAHEGVRCIVSAPQFCTRLPMPARCVECAGRAERAGRAGCAGCGMARQRASAAPRHGLHAVPQAGPEDYTAAQANGIAPRCVRVSC